jgi:mRNA interferase MazF
VGRRQAPHRGDVVVLNFAPSRKNGTPSVRPALTISPEGYNHAVGVALFCPIVSITKGYPFEVEVPAGMEFGGVVLADQLKRLDWRERRAQRIGRLPAAVVDEVLRKLATLVG